MGPVIKLMGVTAIALLINLPLGYLRQNYEKFTFGWYFYIHISIPIIIYLRVKSGFSWHFIPITIGGAVIGQILGGRIKRKLAKNG